MTPVDKYLWLIELLLKKDGMTFKEINEKWLHDHDNPDDPEYRRDIEKRTFRNHIIAIKNEYGIDIECRSGYRYYIVNPLKEVLPKFEHISMQNRLNEIAFNSKLSKNFFIDTYFELLRERNVTRIMDAIKLRRIIKLCKIDYSHMLEDKDLVYSVAPYQLHYINLKWYVIGLTDGTSLMRFPLNLTMEDVQITDDTFKYPTNYSPLEYSKKIYGTTNERIKLTILLWELKSLPYYFDRYPLMPFQHEVEYGCWCKDGSKYNVRIKLDLPKTPFALHVLKERINTCLHIIEDNIDPFALFTKEQYDEEVYNPVVL